MLVSLAKGYEEGSVTIEYTPDNCDVRILYIQLHFSIWIIHKSNFTIKNVIYFLNETKISHRQVK